MRRLASVYFGGENFERLAQVLDHTAARHCPGWKVSVERMAQPPVRHYLGMRDHYIHNTQKLFIWQRIVRDSNDGDELLLIDTDTMILKSLDPAWDESFDVAYTGHRNGHLPFNGGVIFLRIGDASRRFMDLWVERNQELMLDRELHDRWRAVCDGMNQAALASLLDEPLYGMSVLELPCAEWNAADPEDWKSLDGARILHIKGRLRQAVFGGDVSACRLRLYAVSRRWHDVEREMIAAEGLRAAG